MSDTTEIQRLMKMAKTCKGTAGIFACVPRLQSSGANTGYNNNETAALRELEVNIGRNLPAILKQEQKEDAALAHTK